MASDAMDEYYIYDNRLASFTAPQAVAAKRRGSTASSRAPKALTWPHKSIKPAEMAKAGFVFTPLPSNPDNVTCFLCTKALDGWEQDDNPLEEHLKHSPECGWAITAAVEAQLGAYATEDPRDALMVEARKATFGDKWPHENTKGWSSVKTKALVEAGWKYTPLVGSEDNATCAYCHLALDDWNKNDKPWDEHYSRAMHCPFFSLISSKPAPKKAGRSKAARSSKASRLSLQSMVTGVSDMTSLADVTGDIDDSVMTTASNMTTASKASKKSTNARKAPATRAKKTRAKKSEAVEVHEVEIMSEPEQEPKTEEGEEIAPPAPKPARGHKRASDEVDDSVTTNAEAPALKKRATKTRKARGSSATEVSTADTEMVDAPEPVKKPAAKKAARKASGTRKASGRSTRKPSASTVASAASPQPQIPDDDEIDRQLEADLDRPLDDDEDVPMDADPETKRAAASRKEQDGMDTAVDDILADTAETNFAMFDPNPPQPSDEEIEADLQAMQDNMDVDVKEPEPEPEQKPESQELVVPKKGRKAGTRKVSKQTTTKKAKEVAAPVVEQPQPIVIADAEDVDEIAEAEVSFASTGTVKRTSVGRASLGRASLPRASLDSVTSTATTKAPAKRGRPAKKTSHVSFEEPPVEAAAPADSVVYPTLPDMEVDEVEDTTATKAPTKRGRPAKKVSRVPVEETVVASPPPPEEKASHPPVEDSADVPPPSDTVVYPALEPMEVDEEPTSKSVLQTDDKKKTSGKPRGRPPKSKTSNVSSSGEQTIARASAEPEPAAKPEPNVQTEIETEEAHVEEKFSSAVNSPRIARKPVPIPKNSPVAIQRKAVGSASIAPPERLAPPPKTPRHNTAATQSAKQASVSPSPSPQASDAENQPPSSLPGTNSSKRLPLGELPITTPARQTSPSKQQQGKVVAGLQSTEQWTAADLDLVFEGENAGPARRFFAEGDELSARERGMTVEEWIYYNAGVAESKLKSECEAMVSAFEREGTRAMGVLEGLVAEA